MTSLQICCSVPEKTFWKQRRRREDSHYSDRHNTNMHSVHIMFCRPTESKILFRTWLKPDRTIFVIPTEWKRIDCTLHVVKRDYNSRTTWCHGIWASVAYGWLKPGEKFSRFLPSLLSLSLNEFKRVWAATGVTQRHSRASAWRRAIEAASFATVDAPLITSPAASQTKRTGTEYREKLAENSLRNCFRHLCYPFLSVFHNISANGVFFVILFLKKINKLAYTCQIRAAAVSYIFIKFSQRFSV